ncbi:MAG: methyltransferase domain-containing protein [Bacteroidales bacterium]|nr:methyltransferase domain-containing protein [Lachnoclostridium sp.]MCM1383939.1 methyltransferase domain-containing protein [Lachnoclostridium sp.]MCM1464648.1 methyltransferase domain-containing protein [Bacteroidales bacterium]
MWENIKEEMEQGNFIQARVLLEAEKELRGNCPDDIFAILDASVYEAEGDRKGMFDAIAAGLSFNPSNYELYYMLGNYYLAVNPNQAFLCFENAEFYCDDAEDLAMIQQEERQLAESGFGVSPVSVVILSYNAKEEMALCLNSLRKYGGIGREGEIIVIDNASTDGVTDYLKEQKDIWLVCNTENAGFPVGCNQGIKIASPDNDIFLLNNDTVLAPNAIFWLRMGLYENVSVGGTGSVTNYAGNYQTITDKFASLEEYMDYARQHNIPMEYPYEKRLCLIGFAFLIKRKALDAVGLLDERFSPGNFEDIDLSYRLIQAGHQLLLCRNSFIFHFGSRGFSQDVFGYNRLMETNAIKFRDKWGFDGQYYSNERRELTEYIEEVGDAPLKVLEIGCGMGATLGHIRNRYPNAEVYGIELSEQVVQIARNYLPSVNQGNIENISLEYQENFFDYIIFGDVLEHLHNPQKVLMHMQKYLKSSGFILASIPNILHYSVILELLRGKFSYTDSGILDRTHLRFFTLYEIVLMFKECGYRIEAVTKRKTSGALSEEDKGMLDALLQLPGVVSRDNFEVYQYLVKAGKEI